MKCKRCAEDAVEFKKLCVKCIEKLSARAKQSRIDIKNAPIVEDGFKRCNRCYVIKPEIEFIHGKLKCRDCYVKCREYYKENREKEIERAKRSNENKDRNLENIKKRERKQKNPIVYMLHSTKTRAKFKGIPFDITIEDLSMPEKCPLLGIDLKFGIGHVNPNSPTIDRIDSSKGYVKGNVHIISHRANTIKSNATIQELKMIVECLENVLNRK